MTCRTNASYAPLGRSGWITVFCRCHLRPIYYAANGGEAAATLLEMREAA